MRVKTMGSLLLAAVLAVLAYRETQAQCYQICENVSCFINRGGGCNSWYTPQGGWAYDSNFGTGATLHDRFRTNYYGDGGLYCGIFCGGGSQLPANAYNCQAIAGHVLGSSESYTCDAVSTYY